MKEESVLNVLIYLVKNYFRSKEAEHTSYASLLEKLENAGFDPHLISRTFVWVRQLVSENAVPTVSLRHVNPTRIYSTVETEKLNVACRGFLTYLEQCAILKPKTREMVINQAMALDEDIDVQLLKWITLLVLLTQPDEQEALSRVEFLILDSPTDFIH